MPPRKKKKPKQPAAPKPQLRVRMYRHGLGDCLLLTFQAADGKPFQLMIDCGLIQNEPPQRLGAAIDHLLKETGGQVDVLAATHEHWDHVGGFLEFKDKFEGFGAAEVWVGWTENPNDTLAQTLRAEHAEALAAVGLAAQRLPAPGPRGRHQTPDQALASGVGELLSFFNPGSRFGAAPTGAALAEVKKRGPVRFCRPDDAPWTHARLPGVRIYTLGPPRSQQAINRLIAKHEVYGAADAELVSGFKRRLERDAVPGSDLEADEKDQPFDPSYRINLRSLEAQAGPDSEVPLAAFFQRQYYGAEAWRRIETDWLGAAQDFALKLDSATNNTSLVLAVELPDGKVLLFAGDAQVGSWLTWQDLKWTVEGKTVTGPELLSRAVFYKVGHHGSHNATLKHKGLEQMTSGDLVAFIPVDARMAAKKGWHQMPLPELEAALHKQTGGRVVRADKDFPTAESWLKADPLFYDFLVP